MLFELAEENHSVTTLRWLCQVRVRQQDSGKGLEAVAEHPHEVVVRELLGDRLGNLGPAPRSLV